MARTQAVLTHPRRQQNKTINVPNNENKQKRAKKPLIILSLQRFSVSAVYQRTAARAFDRSVRAYDPLQRIFLSLSWFRLLLMSWLVVFFIGKIVVSFRKFFRVRFLGNCHVFF